MTVAKQDAHGSAGEAPVISGHSGRRSRRSGRLANRPPERVTGERDATWVGQGPSVTYHLRTRLSVPSRHDEQVIEVAKIDLTPAYYFKAIPALQGR
jgi:hypothetical protein